MLIASLATLALLQGADTQRLLRYPDVHGDKVVFTYATDLWITDLKGGVARRLTSHPGSEVFARFSPDGKWIAFTGQYDSPTNQVYVIPAEGGQPTRLTWEPVPAIVTNWTPDGLVAYTSAYGSETNRMQRLWKVRPTGGMPIRTPLEEAVNASFSPDGKRIAYNRMNSYGFNWRHYRGGTQGRISFWDTETNAYSEIPQGREQSHHPMWVGKYVYYTSDRTASTQNLFRYDTETERVEQLTKFTDADVRFPQTDGAKIVYERNGELFSYNIADGAITQVDPTIAGDLVRARPQFRRLASSVEGLSLSPSGKRLALTARGFGFSVPAGSGETRMIGEELGGRTRDVMWTPDGQNFAFLNDSTGEWALYTAPQRGGAPTRVNLPADHRISIDRGPGPVVFSPDGKKIAYTTIDDTLWVFDTVSGQSKKVYRDDQNVASFDWSPDSKWIAYTVSLPSRFRAITLYDVEADKSHQASSGVYNDFTPVFDLNGKYLYFLSMRDFGFRGGTFEISLYQADNTRVYVLPLSAEQTDPLLPPSDEEPLAAPAAAPGAGGPGGPPAPAAVTVKIDFDGIADRAVALPWPPGTFAFLTGSNNGVFTFAGGSLVRFDMGSRTPQTIMTGAGGFTFNQNRTMLAYTGPGGLIGVSPVRPDIPVGTGRVNTDGVAATIDPKREWAQMYWEAWRFYRDYFYDPNMVGLDWKAVGERWAKLLPSVSSREELNWIIGQLVGELGTGHAYVSGGEQLFQPTQPPAGMLGADYGLEGKWVRFAKIYRGENHGDRGPLGAPGVDVREGDYLMAINGTPVTSDINVHSLLVDRANRPVNLTVNSRPSMVGARTVTVRPVGDEFGLRYVEWVRQNREYVDMVSGGRIGYIHVPDTAIGGITEFVKGFYAQTDKAAWIIDERYNGGGFIPTFFIEALNRTLQAAAVTRHGLNWSFPDARLDGPKAMLINSYAGSGGDMLPWLFRRNNLGPLIGTRTWGGLVGLTGGVALADGGSVQVPEFAIFDPERGEWIAENTGVDPDIEVDERPDLVAQGKDPILDRALEYLKDQMRRNPPREHKVPAAPRVQGRP